MKRNSDTPSAPLRELAALYNIQTAYVDLAKTRRHASKGSLLAMLTAMGAPVCSERDANDALRERKRDLRQRVLEPVYVARAGTAPIRITASVPVAQLKRTASVRLAFDYGGEATYPLPLDHCTILDRERIDRREYATVQLELPPLDAIGYHKLTFELGAVAAKAVVISAPKRCYEPRSGAKRWGCFLPLYALRTQTDWGIGDFSALDRLVDWTRKRGGAFAGTLPMLAAFLDEPCDYSPYSPVSRRFWNEIFIDVTEPDEWRLCKRARELAGTSTARRDLRTLRKSDLVDYRRVMAIKRACLTEMAKVAATNNPEFDRFERTRRDVGRYASFRAACERYGVPWWNWPKGPREGDIGLGDLDADAITYHTYVQWLAESQLAKAALERGSGEHEIYLDFPLGVHPAGYDTWQDREVFVQGLSLGAPPDAFFRNGQNWGLPALHPDHLRRTGYRYLRESLSVSMRYASILRIDHVMALHRVFCVPDGFEPADGAYVRFPANEMYGVLALESHRHRAEIVGEDLGTVPQEVRAAMNRNGVKRMYVLQFSIGEDAESVIEPPPDHCLASVNTHDTPTFAGYFSGDEIDERVGLKLLTEEEAVAERQTRQAVRGRLRTFLAQEGLVAHARGGMRAVMHGLLNYLAESEADLVLVNLEDLWLEKSPQNVPGTSTELPNWRRKASRTFEEFSTDKHVLKLLRDVDICRTANAMTK